MLWSLEASRKPQKLKMVEKHGGIILMCIIKIVKLKGPVVQSIVSLTSLLSVLQVYNQIH